MQFLTVCLFIAVCIELFQKLFTSIDQLIKIAMTLFRLYVGLRIHFFSSTNSATKNSTIHSNLLVTEKNPFHPNAIRPKILLPPQLRLQTPWENILSQYRDNLIKKICLGFFKLLTTTPIYDSRYRTYTHMMTAILLTKHDHICYSMISLQFIFSNFLLTVS